MSSIIDDFASIGAKLSEIEKKIPQPETDTADKLAKAISETWMYSVPVDQQDDAIELPDAFCMAHDWVSGEKVQIKMPATGGIIHFAWTEEQRDAFYSQFGWGFQIGEA